MIDLISLRTLNSIFNIESLFKLSPKASLAYIQCLIYHFEDLEPKIVNLKGFDIKKNVINKKSIYLFLELEKAGLLKVNEESITFINHWAKYIDKSKLEKVQPHEYLALMDYKKAISYKEDLLNSGSFLELIQMEFKIDQDKVECLINRFFNEQSAHHQSYPNYQGASRHCLSWIKKELKKTSTIGIINKTVTARNNAHDIINKKYGE